MGTQEIIDELRGELDRANMQEPGWSGPVTTAYIRGYGAHPMGEHHKMQDEYRRTHVEMAWYT